MIVRVRRPRLKGVLDPETMVRVQTAHVLFWVAVTILSTVTGLINSKAYISEVSNIALILSAGAWLESAHVRRTQAREDVVSELVEKTDIEPKEAP